MVRLNGGSTVESNTAGWSKAQATQGSRHTGDVLFGRKGSHEATRLERKKQRINMDYYGLQSTCVFIWVIKRYIYIYIYIYVYIYIYMYICKIIMTNMDNYWIADSIFTQLLVFHKQLTAHLLICWSENWIITAKNNGVSSSSLSSSSSSSSSSSTS